MWEGRFDTEFVDDTALGDTVLVAIILRDMCVSQYKVGNIDKPLL
jgi:hypothetical protein